MDDPFRDEELTPDDVAEICLSDIADAGGRLDHAEIAPDLPGLAAEWLPEGVRRGLVRIDARSVEVTIDGLQWLERDRSVEVSVPSGRGLQGGFSAFVRACRGLRAR